jgi:hypothetical protein
MEAAQARFENLIAQLQGVVPNNQLAAALNSSGVAETSRVRDNLEAANGDILELDLGLEGDVDDDDDDEEEKTDPAGYCGVMDAVYRLKHELPARLAADPAWAQPIIARLWESYVLRLPR